MKKALFKLSEGFAWTGPELQLLVAQYHPKPSRSDLASLKSDLLAAGLVTATQGSRGEMLRLTDRGLELAATLALQDVLAKRD